jgi:hypothetical protein
MLSAHAPQTSSTAHLSWQDRRFLLACEILGGFRVLQRSHVRIGLLEGRLLGWIQKSRAERRLGFASLADFTTQMLHLDGPGPAGRLPRQLGRDETMGRWTGGDTA